jgi:hypothetical protein
MVRRVSDRYVPAAGRAMLTPLYDGINAIAMRQGRWRPRLVERAVGSGAPTRILDLGCGTGEMALAIARASRTVTLIGIDEACGARRGAARPRPRRTALGMRRGPRERSDNACRVLCRAATRWVCKHARACARRTSRHCVARRILGRYGVWPIPHRRRHARPDRSASLGPTGTKSRPARNLKARDHLDFSRSCPGQGAGGSALPRWRRAMPEPCTVDGSMGGPSQLLGLTPCATRDLADWHACSRPWGVAQTGGLSSCLCLRSCVGRRWLAARCFRASRPVVW